MPSRTLAERRGDRRERNGLIFVCDQSTEEECLSRRLLGLPKSQSTLLAKMREVLRTPSHLDTRGHLVVAASTNPHSVSIPAFTHCNRSIPRKTSLLFLFNVKTRQLLGVFHPDGPAGLDLQLG